MQNLLKEYLPYFKPNHCIESSKTGRDDLLPNNTLIAEANETKETDQLLLDKRVVSNEEPLLSFVRDHIYWNRPVTLLEDLLTTMGGCFSIGGGNPLIADLDGNEQDFHNRFIEDRVLGQGEFGVVNLVHDMKSNGMNNAMACKVLRKGAQFRHNTIYSALKPEVLQGEVAMLRTLNGEHFCLGLMAVYETPRAIYMVTEHCAGGEMMEYISKQEEDLRTDDVSRIAFQMLDAVNHCAKHDIIHRDIKPENVMFQHPTPGSDLRIIDFGSGTNRIIEGMHITFAGSAFYISPEMFQRTYTQKTDVWSTGVTLYCLVAGYPADSLQTAFNLLQSNSNKRELRKLPGFPDDVPNSFYDMLDGLLIYHHKRRKTAGEMLEHEFVKFHKSAFSFDQIALHAQQDPPSKERMSMSISGSVSRHTKILDFQKYQRSLTTLMATLLDKHKLAQLMKDLNEMVESEKRKVGEQGTNQEAPEEVFQKHLDVIPLNELKQTLKSQSQEQV
jgi:serine/threonine protein kinase